MGSGSSSGFKAHNLVCFTGEETDTYGTHAKPKEDKPKYQLRSWSINFVTQEGVPRPSFIIANLPAELRQTLLTLLQDFNDVFPWRYTQMPWLDSQLLIHRLKYQGESQADESDG